MLQQAKPWGQTTKREKYRVTCKAVVIEGELFECVSYRDLLIDLGPGELDEEMKAGDGVGNRPDGWKRVYRLHFGTVIEVLRSCLWTCCRVLFREPQLEPITISNDRVDIMRN